MKTRKFMTNRLNKKLFSIIFGLLAFAFLLPQVMAAGIATLRIQGGTEQVTLEFMGSNAVRLYKDDEGFLLLRNGQLFSVGQVAGRTVVANLTEMDTPFMNLPVQSGSDILSQELISIKSLGRKETVAGIRGEAYLVTWLDDEGTHKGKIVLSNNKRVREFTRSWMNISLLMQKVKNNTNIVEGTLWAFLDEENKGVLRMGKDFVVKSLVTKNLSKSRFKLPRRPMSQKELKKVFASTSGSSKSSGNHYEEQEDELSYDENAMDDEPLYDEESVEDEPVYDDEEYADNEPVYDDNPDEEVYDDESVEEDQAYSDEEYSDNEPVYNDESSENEAAYDNEQENDRYADGLPPYMEDDRQQDEDYDPNKPIWARILDRVNKTTERQADKTERRTESEIDRKVDQAIDKVLNKVFGD